MLEVKIPKEIMEYHERILLGMSIRQFACLCLAIAVSVGSYLLCLLCGLSDDISSTVAMALCMPPLAVGFIRVGGYNFETYVRIMARYYISSKVLLYQTYEESLIAEEEKAANANSKPKRKKFRSPTEADVHPIVKKSLKRQRRLARRASKAVYKKNRTAIPEI